MDEFGIARCLEIAGNFVKYSQKLRFYENFGAEF